MMQGVATPCLASLYVASLLVIFAHVSTLPMVLLWWEYFVLSLYKIVYKLFCVK